MCSRIGSIIIVLFRVVFVVVIIVVCGLVKFIWIFRIIIIIMIVGRVFRYVRISWCVWDWIVLVWNVFKFVVDFIV